MLRLWLLVLLAACARANEAGPGDDDAEVDETKLATSQEALDEQAKLQAQFSAAQTQLAEVQKTNKETMEELEEESKLEEKDGKLIESELRLKEKLAKADAEKSRALAELKHLEQAKGIASMSPQRLHAFAISKGKNLTKEEEVLQKAYDASTQEIMKIQELKTSLFEKDTAIARGIQEADPLGTEEAEVADDAMILQEQISKRKAANKQSQIKKVIVEEQQQVVDQEKELSAISHSLEPTKAKEKQLLSALQEVAKREQNRAKNANMQLEHLHGLDSSLRYAHRDLKNLSIRLDEASEETQLLVDRKNELKSAATASRANGLSVLSIRQNFQEQDSQALALKSQIQQAQKELSSTEAELVSEVKLRKDSEANFKKAKAEEMQQAEAKHAKMTNELTSLQTGKSFVQYVVQSKIAKAEANATAEDAAKLAAFQKELANETFQLQSSADVTQAQILVTKRQAEEAEKQHMKAQSGMETEMQEFIKKSNISVTQSLEAIALMSKQLEEKPGEDQQTFRDYVAKSAVPVHKFHRQVVGTSEEMDHELEDLQQKAKEADRRMEEIQQASGEAHRRFEDAEKRIQDVFEEVNSSQIVEEKKDLEERLTSLRAGQVTKIKDLKAQLEQIRQSKKTAEQAKQERAAVEQLNQEFDKLKSKPPVLQEDEEEDADVQDVLREMEDSPEPSFVQLRQAKVRRFLRRAS